MPKKSQAQLDMETSGLLAQPENKEAILHVPGDLTPEQQSLYAKVYAANPSAHLFTDAIHNVLKQYVRHCVASDDLAALIAQTDKQEDPRLYISLLRAQRDESLAMASLSTKLRLAPSSTSGYRGEFKPKAASPKPWEWDQAA